MRNANNLPPSCAVITKSGNLNFLEPSRPVQACNGTGLLYFTMSELATYSCMYSECQVIFDGLPDLGLYFMLPIAKSLCSHCTHLCVYLYVCACVCMFARARMCVRMHVSVCLLL